MVKRQKEKQYQSATEQRAYSQIRSGRNASEGGNGSTKPLPFDCCALTLTPFENPVCSPAGVIFETSAIIPYLMKYGKDPVTGESMSTRDLITLQMFKDEDNGKWQCPVLCKPFTNNTKIVAIKQNPPGNEAIVYSFEAVQELNLKPKNYLDLTSGKKFHREKDIITIQDTSNQGLMKLRDINNFKHVSMLREETMLSEQIDTGTNKNINMSVTASRIMDQMKRKRESEQKQNEDTNKKTKSDIQCSDKPTKIFTDDLNGVKLTTGKASGSFTSTSMTVSNTNEAREATEEEILQSKFYTMKRLKKKGFVRLVTNLGILDLELHCDIAPRTCTNFIGLAEEGKYDGSKFHRSIRNFMIQGGKPSKKDEAETSLWGNPFVDEFDDRLKHQGPGILSMANAGPGTNKRQFFITFKSAPHLDRKHSVFGKVVKGIDVLKKMEQIECDNKDRPIEDIIIEQAQVYINPVKEAEEIERSRIQKRIEERKHEKEIRSSSRIGNDAARMSTPSSSSMTSSDLPSQPKVEIGKYFSKKLQAEIQTRLKDNESVKSKKETPSRLPTSNKGTKFGDFSGW